MGFVKRQQCHNAGRDDATYRSAQIEMGIFTLRKTREINHVAEFPRKVDISDRNLYRTPRTPPVLLLAHLSA